MLVRWDTGSSQEDRFCPPLLRQEVAAGRNALLSERTLSCLIDQLSTIHHPQLFTMEIVRWFVPYLFEIHRRFIRNSSPSASMEHMGSWGKPLHRNDGDNG